jgi:Ran-binding protein 9/10
MIRQGAEMQKSTSANGAKKSNGHNGDWYDDIINHDMDLDDHQPQNSSNWDRMDTEESLDNQVEYGQLLADTIAYGQNLQAEFRDDPRREIGKALNDAFALLAYQDPLNEKEVAHRLDISGRITVAEELNSAILCEFNRLLNSHPYLHTHKLQYP